MKKFLGFIYFDKFLYSNLIKISKLYNTSINNVIKTACYRFVHDYIDKGLINNEEDL